MVPHAPMDWGVRRRAQVPSTRLRRQPRCGYPRVAMPSTTPLAVLLSAAPGASGAAEAAARMAEAASEGRPVRVLLTAEGLAWAGEAYRADLPAAADVAVCSLNAREAGWTAEDTPAGIRWSSVATWLAELDAEGRAALWAVTP